MVLKYKRTKMGHVPGDKSIQSLAAMLEGKAVGNDGRGAKAFKKEQVRIANRRLRRKKPTIEE